MFRNLLKRFRWIIVGISRGARAIGNCHLEAGCTQAEIRAVNLLRNGCRQNNWLNMSPIGILMLLAGRAAKGIASVTARR